MRWTLGATEVRRIEETVQTRFKPEVLFPDFERQALAEHAAWMVPEFFDFVWEDSVAPVVAAGQAQVIDDGYVLDDVLTVEPAPGHTLGHVRIRLRDGGAEAIFSGDLMHVPLQVYCPQWHTCLDDAPADGVKSRIALLETCVETNALLPPTHFAAPHCCRIGQRPGGFGIDWPA